MNRVRIPVLIMVLVALSGCRDNGRIFTQITPSPPGAVGHRFALEFARAIQERLDDAVGPGAIEVGPMGVRQIAPYGEVVLLKMTRSKLRLTRSTTSVVNAMADSTETFLDELEDLADAEGFVGMQIASGGRMYLAARDLVAAARGDLDRAQLRQRAVFESPT